jgi:hypothetical protein
MSNFSSLYFSRHPFHKCNIDSLLKLSQSQMAKVAWRLLRESWMLVLWMISLMMLAQVVLLESSMQVLVITDGSGVSLPFDSDTVCGTCHIINSVCINHDDHGSMEMDVKAGT